MGAFLDKYVRAKVPDGKINLELGVFWGWNTPVGSSVIRVSPYKTVGGADTPNTYIQAFLLGQSRMIVDSVKRGSKKPWFPKPIFRNVFVSLVREMEREFDGVVSERAIGAVAKTAFDRFCSEYEHAFLPEPSAREGETN